MESESSPRRERETDSLSPAAQSQEPRSTLVGVGPADPLVSEGSVIGGKYRVERIIGSGGMGLVVSATHVTLNERVALKLLRFPHEERGRAIARFLREARAAVRIKSEHVARVTDVATTEDGTPYFVMELLAGQDLADVLQERGPLAVEEATDLAIQACEAVAAAHAAGIVHRDLKPSNLFLTHRTDGSPLLKVLDFGIAKALEREGAESDADTLTASTAILGSPDYMSPEQVRSSRTVDERSDVWSLGVILYEMLTGELPFEGDSRSARLAAIAADDPRPLKALRPDAPAALSATIARCLRKDPRRRLQSVAALAREICTFGPPHARTAARRIETALGTTADDAGGARSRRDQAGWIRSRWRVAVPACALACVVAFAVLHARSTRQPSAQPDETARVAPASPSVPASSPASTDREAPRAAGGDNVPAPARDTPSASARSTPARATSRGPTRPPEDHDLETATAHRK